MITYTVRQGDCMASIAAAHGFDWATLWSSGENAELRARRKNPNLLCPGDVVVVPDQQTTAASGASGKRHPFRAKGVPARLKFRLMKEGGPRAGEPYTLEVDGTLRSGQTDGSGTIDVPIPPGAQTGTLLLKNGLERYKLNLGHLDPIDEVTGVQARLNALGFHCGDVDGDGGPCTRNALARFQYVHGLSPSGDCDPQTRRKLEDVYGC